MSEYQKHADLWKNQAETLVIYNEGYENERREGWITEHDDIPGVRFMLGSSTHGNKDLLWFLVDSSAGKFGYPLSLNQSQSEYQRKRQVILEGIVGEYDPY